MNIQKLFDYCGGTTPHFDYLENLAERVEGALGSDLTLAEGIALMNVLIDYSFRFDDGFIINDERDINKGIWLSDAAVLAASLCKEPDLDFLWWKAEYPAFDQQSELYETIFNDVLARNLRSPSVHIREVGEP